MTRHRSITEISGYSMSAILAVIQSLIAHHVCTQHAQKQQPAQQRQAVAMCCWPGCGQAGAHHNVRYSINHHHPPSQASTRQPRHGAQYSSSTHPAQLAYDMPHHVVQQGTASPSSNRYRTVLQHTVQQHTLPAQLATNMPFCSTHCRSASCSSTEPAKLQHTLLQ